MPLKLKSLIGIYIISILFISGVSEASASQGFLENSKGTVFEVDGYLFFEQEGAQSILLHSSNFSFFENLELPVEVHGMSIVTTQDSGFPNSLTTVRFIKNSIKEIKSL